MCELSSGSSTIIGPAGALREVQEIWESLRTVRRFELYRQPLLSTLAEIGDHWGFNAPAVLGVDHPHVSGHIVADELSIELTVVRQLPVMCEMDYPVGLAMSGLPGQAAAQHEWDIQFDVNAVGAAAGPWGFSPLSTGKRVAVIDSGASESMMLDMVHDQPRDVFAEDEIGHGTAIARLISWLSPGAQVHPIRVLVYDPGESRHLLLGLAAALWPDEDGNARYDAVNVSLTRQLVDTCSTSLGRTMAFVRALCSQHGKIPPVIAAVGNKTQHQQFGYPAALPDAYAAVALAWDGTTATYNVDVPPGTQVKTAFGGTEAQPFGYLTTAGSSAPLYGSSFAAAVATCEFLNSP